MEGNGEAKLGRRALLAAGAAGVAAVAAEAVAPAAVHAADGWDMKIGDTNLGNHTTVLKTAGAHGFDSESDAGDGLRGLSGGSGKSGVYGRASHAGGFGVYGRNTASDAYGYLGGQENGVYGASSVQGKAAVKGEQSHPTGAAVVGANTATQVMGGLATGGSGLYGSAPVNQASAALYVSGRAMFERSGLLTIGAGKSSVSAVVAAIGAGGPLPTMVLATLQTNRAGVHIQAAVLNPAASKVTIYLNRKVTAATKVAYFVLN